MKNWKEALEKEAVPGSETSNWRMYISYGYAHETLRLAVKELEKRAREARVMTCNFRTRHGLCEMRNGVYHLCRGDCTYYKEFIKLLKE